MRATRSLALGPLLAAAALVSASATVVHAAASKVGYAIVSTTSTTSVTVPGTVIAATGDGQGGFFASLGAQVVHIASAGTIDPGFAYTATAPRFVEQLALAPGGRLVVVESGGAPIQVAIVTAATGAVEHLGPQLVGSRRSSGGLAMIGSTAYVAGSFRSVVSGPRRTGVVAVNTATGGVLPFNPGLDRDASGIAASFDRIYLTGAFRTIGGKARAHLAAVSPSGKPLAWRPQLPVAPEVASLAAGPHSFFATTFHRVIALRSDDGRRLTWGKALSDAYRYLQPTSVQYDNAVLYIGNTAGPFTVTWRGAKREGGCIGIDTRTGKPTPWQVKLPGLVTRTCVPLATSAHAVLVMGRFAPPA